MSSQRERRIAVGIILGTLALTALFLAQGTTRLVAAATLGPDEEATPVATGPARGPGARTSIRQRKNADPILKKNIFDSESGDLTAVPQDDLATGAEPEEPAPVRWPDDPADVQVCSGGTRLVATIVAPSFPEWSFAAVADGATQAMLYRTGMEVGGKTLVGIQGDLVYMAPPTGTVCKLQMFRPGAPPAAAPADAAEEEDEESRRAKRLAARRARRGEKEGPISDEELDQGIQKVSDNEYNIDRSLVNKILENQAELMRSARIIPHEQGGRVVGVKLYGIRRTSVLGKLGVQNGDMLRNINGFDMASPDSALEAYTKLRNADHLTVAVVRRGNPMTIDYNIQ